MVWLTRTCVADPPSWNCHTVRPSLPVVATTGASIAPFAPRNRSSTRRQVDHVSQEGTPRPPCRRAISSTAAPPGLRSRSSSRTRRSARCRPRNRIRSSGSATSTARRIMLSSSPAATTTPIIERTSNEVRGVRLSGEPQHGVNYPAPAGMRAGVAQVAEDHFAGTTGVLEGVGKIGQVAEAILVVDYSRQVWGGSVVGE